MFQWPHLKISLQTRILLLTIMVSTLVLIVSDKLSMISSVKALENEIGERTTMAANSLAGDLRHAGPDALPSRFHRSLEKVLDLVPNILRVDVYAQTKKGLTLVITNSNPKERNVEEFELSALKTGESDTYTVEEGNGYRRIVAVEPFHLLGDKPGFVTVISSLKPVSDLTTIHSRIRFYTLAATILLLVAAITMLFRTTVYRSVLHLVSTMNQFQTGNHLVRAQERLPGEFTELASHLNRMLAEISQFHANMKLQIQAATDTLARRNQDLENLNLLLYETQKRLLQSERLALVGQLTATFAHEIGSPLSAVSTHLQLLQEDRQLSVPIRERLKLVDAEITRICGIVENLLANSRSAYCRIPVDVADIIGKVAHLLGPMLQSRQISFTFSDEREPWLTLGNPDQLQQLFLNLFNNSLDAISGGGSIEIRLARRQENAQAYLEIQVFDSGCGIPADKLDHIFEPFFTTKDFGKGTGLGLAVCQEIVRRHGGTISVESLPGQSAVFTIRLPEMLPANPATETVMTEEAPAV